MTLAHAQEDFPLSHFWNPKVPRVTQMDGGVTLTIHTRSRSGDTIGPFQVAVNASAPDQCALEILDPVIGSIASYQCVNQSCHLALSSSAKIPHAARVQKILEQVLAPLSAQDLSKIFRGALPVKDATHWRVINGNLYGFDNLESIVSRPLNQSSPVEMRVLRKLPKSEFVIDAMSKTPAFPIMYTRMMHEQNDPKRPLSSITVTRDKLTFAKSMLLPEMITLHVNNAHNNIDLEANITVNTWRAQP